jgi:hypothetical protein
MFFYGFRANIFQRLCQCLVRALKQNQVANFVPLGSGFCLFILFLKACDTVLLVLLVFIENGFS